MHVTSQPPSLKLYINIYLEASTILNYFLEGTCRIVTGNMTINLRDMKHETSASLSDIFCKKIRDILSLRKSLKLSKCLVTSICHLF